ncbi:MAG: hypothetical protein IPN33_09275 [Saprospiraceae bacterium]|nr:hypothetical protein [Saprospiraceae bacterium]
MADMTGTKLITLLAALSRHELQSFRKYLASPFFNDNKDIGLLLDNILPFLLDNSQPLEKQQLWQAVFGAKPYDDDQFRRLNSELTQQALSFLGFRQYKRDAWRPAVDLLPQLAQRKLDKHFAGAAKQAREALQKHPLRDADYHFGSHLLALYGHQYLEQSGSKVIDYQNLEQADFHLDCYYIAQKLRHYCDALDYRNTLSLQADIHLFPQFLDMVRQSRYYAEPIIAAYFLVASMLLHPEEESYFRDLKQLLAGDEARFSDQALRAFYIYLFNYCIDTKINTGQPAYFTELFELYQRSLQQGFIIKDGILPTQDYKNIITVGLHVRAYDWVEGFIRQYTGKLPPDDQLNATNFNLAKVFFSQKQYTKVIEQLREVEYPDIVYALGSKLMLLKTYYELNEYIALDSLIDSFRVYLQRNQTISRGVKYQYLNVLRFVKLLSNTMPRDKPRLDKIRAQINACEALADKAWILEKLEELRG